MKPAARAMVAVPGAWVTLHRVGTDTAGPLDSTRTSATGAYTFTYRRFGADDAIYFVSSMYGGVAYISKPLQPGTTRGDAAEIDVFDTTSRPVPMTVRGRHLIVSAAGPGGVRTVTEVFDLSNDGSVTRIAAGETPEGAVWASVLPTGARQPQVAEGDVPAQSVKFADGRALVYAPFAPGMKQLVYNYTLPADAFPMSLPLQRQTAVLEVLVEEPRATVTGAALRVVAPVTVEGRHFTRYLASEVPANAALTVEVPKGDPTDEAVSRWYMAGLTLVIGGAMTAVLARAVRRR